MPHSSVRVCASESWVSTTHAHDAEIRLYDRLFTVENPLKDNKKEFTDFINPDSLEIINAKIEQNLAKASPGDRFQFERVGYFCADLDHKKEKAIFNRTLSLRAPKKVN